MSPCGASFVQSSAVPTQAVSPYYAQQQQQLEHLLLSPINACGHGAWENGSTHLLVDPAPSAYSDTPPPSIARVTDGHWYPPGTDSTPFSSKLSFSSFLTAYRCLYRVK